MIMGGANQVQIQPHTMETSAGIDATRQAINIIHLATEESHLETFRDPAAGSFSADMLTHQLAKAAWEQFVVWNEIGFEELIRSNTLQNAINEQADTLQKSFAAQKLAMVGVNIFPSEFSKASPPLPEMPISESPEFKPLKPVFLDV